VFECRLGQTNNGNRISDAVVSVLSFSAVDRVFEHRSGQTKNGNRISDAVVSVLSFSAVYRVFERLSGQTKDYKISICCFSGKYTALRKKTKHL